MEVKKILVADTAVEFCQALAPMLQSQFDLRICHDGLEAEALLRSYEPDVLVMDLALPGLDGLTLLKRIPVSQNRPKILLTTCYTSGYVENIISNYGVDLVVVKPCSAEVMVDHILDLIEIEVDPAVAAARQRSSISAMLMDLDIPSKRRGFAYLEMCIELYMEKPGQPLTKVIYAEVAKYHDAKQEAVERAMRQLIHETWARRDEKIWRRYFRLTRNGELPRPTNGEFISRLAELQRQSLWDRAL